MATKVSDGIKMKPRVGFSDEAENHQSETSKESHHKKSKGELRFSLSTEKRYDGSTDEEELKLRRARLQQRRGTRYDCYGNEVNDDEDKLQGKKFYENKKSDKPKQTALPAETKTETTNTETTKTETTKNETTKNETTKIQKEEMNNDKLKGICKEKNENPLNVKEEKSESKEETKKEIKNEAKAADTDEENRKPANGTKENKKQESKEPKNGLKQVGLRKLEVSDTKNN